MTTAPRSTPKPWPPEHCTLLSEQYAKGDLKALAAQLGRTVSQLQAKANHLGLARDAATVLKIRTSRPDTQSVRDMLLKMAASPTGTRVEAVAEALQFRRGRVDDVAQNMARAGLLHKARLSHRNTRWFTDPKIAAAINKLAARPAKGPGSTVQGKLTTTPASVAKWSRGPAYLPGEPLITPATRWTIAPPPPARPLHTNTFMFSA